MDRAARIGLAFVVATAGIVLSTVPAAAHATLIGSTPADGETVDAAPTVVDLVFSEPMQRDFAQVAVLNAGGTHHEQGDAEVTGDTVTQAVAGLEPGEYQVSYRVGSADGHPVSGVLTFTVTDAGPASPEPTSTSEPEPTTTPEPTASQPSEPAATQAPDPGAGADDRDFPAAAVGGFAAAALGAAGIVYLAIRRRPGDGPGDTGTQTGPP